MSWALGDIVSTCRAFQIENIRTVQKLFTVTRILLITCFPIDCLSYDKPFFVCLK